LADELVAGTVGWDLARPARDHRNSQSTFKDVCFVTAQRTARVMTVGSQFVELGLWRTTVVAGEDDQRVLLELVPLEGRENLAHGCVGLHDEVGVRIDAALSEPLVGRQNRR